ncbi:tRNA (adenine(58)-N(1))-methyltransferase catalytic subunit TRMT61A-like [Saccoglossus kowalevskii]|uniref:tRNA (adenine(58)-N(1))-methyltransferase catalytic subunit TRMT61A n=1 Tax=Saccoglossus kowalevskii TaxID=10224 RepID=A0ABM0GM37_SACKO|nr:PREDICTED: tRNA (adenine(58)-N(1))-methyltransferase catalytic subunit TRMT61A-like [Saccoglossus kowalevskii]
MSFNQYKDKIEEGDTVILFLGVDDTLTIRIKHGKTHQTRYGAVRHADLIGKQYGSRITCIGGKGWLHVLHPTPELWTITLPHRTQIIYSIDISMITLQLDLKPGSIVCESGTGSGSLSHAIIRSIAPTGHLYTYDYHQQRCDKAREEFTDHGIGDLVTVSCRDVCKDGFDVEHIADAVFLDLPVPWDAIKSAKQAFKLQGGKICSFSPCIEQVQRSCDQLRESGFVEVTTVECIARPYDVKTICLPPYNMGYIEGSTESSDDAPTDTKPKSSLKGFTAKCGILPKETAGHTGFLTFASLYTE